MMLAVKSQQLRTWLGKHHILNQIRKKTSFGVEIFKQFIKNKQGIVDNIVFVSV